MACVYSAWRIARRGEEPKSFRSHSLEEEVPSVAGAAAATAWYSSMEVSFFLGIQSTASKLCLRVCVTLMYTTPHVDRLGSLSKSGWTLKRVENRTTLEMRLFVLKQRIDVEHIV